MQPARSNGAQWAPSADSYSAPASPCLNRYDRLRAGLHCLLARLDAVTTDTTVNGACAMTVTGPVPVGELGPTHVHEHLHIDCRPILEIHGYPVVTTEPLTMCTAAEARWNPGGFPDNYHQTDVEQVLEELAPFHAAGGRTIVEVTPRHMAREPLILRHIAERSGLNVIMGGFYYLAASHPPGTAERSTEDLAAEMVEEWRNGVDDTGIRPGIIGEVGTYDPVQPEEFRMLRAAAWAHAETDLPISIHLHPWGFEGIKVLDALEAEGVDPQRVILGHMNTAIDDLPYQLALLERGVNLAYDLMGFDHSLIGLGKYPPSDYDIVAGMVGLAQRGHLGQLFVSQDMGGVKTRLLAYGGWGYAHTLNHVLPLFRDAGWGEAEVETLIVHNPARVLTIEGLRR
ncbi:MAG: phosphotriesterase-related protein [Acidimicrobiia bacterium]|nr:phosphotriesterase-related protein [Acidimicrobiia bacterium]MYJ14281.1 phosphotriesterase-related protein [Acidimicrobiia bacterium]